MSSWLSSLPRPKLAWILSRRSEKSQKRAVAPRVSTSSFRIATARWVLPTPTGPVIRSPASTAGQCSTKRFAIAFAFFRESLCRSLKFRSRQFL